jgi:hypothetical protein
MPGFFWKNARQTFCECAWNKDAAIKEIINGSYTVPYYSVFQVNKACSSILVIKMYKSALTLYIQGTPIYTILYVMGPITCHAN